MDNSDEKVAKLIAWAAELAEKVERVTNTQCSTTRILAIHAIKTNKLESQCRNRDEAIEKAKVIVANNLLNK